MGLDLSAFMLEGDHVRDAPAIVTGLGCRVEDTLTEVDGEAWASGRFNDGYYTVQLRGNWTILVGPDGDPIGEEEKQRDLSRQYDCRLFSLTFSDSGASYGFQMFVKGSMRRQVVTTGGEIHERGEPFPEEIGMEGDTPDRRIVAVMARLGVCLIGHVLPEADALGEPVRIFVCRSRNTSPEVIAALAGQSHKRPWWKFW